MNNYLDVLTNVEHNDFWLNAKTELFVKEIGKNRSRILDIGCGTGLLSMKLGLLGHEINAIDTSDKIIEVAKQKFEKNKININIWHSSIEQLNIDEKYDFILLADVLEHIEDDRAMLEKLSNMLTPNGKIIVSVPAVKSLWSRHDEFCSHYRRYSKKELRDKLKNNFKIIKLNYWNFTMLPVAFILKLSNTKTYPHESVISVPILSSLLLKYYIYIENKISWPIGLSLFAVAVKRNK